MCGIAGVVRVDGSEVSARVIGNMTDAIRHRGPDGHSVVVGPGFGLGHRRLAIIDLTSSAAQPMESSDGRYVMSYNGEVYNFRELRRELESSGHRFRSSSDTEVVLELMARRGPAGLSQLNGMFAFALWDRQEGSLLLARDRYGIKPLYYAVYGGTVVFGSEIKAIARHPEATMSLDSTGLAEYLTFQNFLTDRTLFAGIRSLPPATWMKVDRNGVEDPVAWYTMEFTEPVEARHEHEYLEELERLFAGAVQRQMVSDVPVNSYLSGGMDTGAITAVAAANTAQLKTFTVGFDTTSTVGMERRFDERADARTLAELSDTEHFEHEVRPGDIASSLAAIVHHLEEPRVGQSYPNYYAAQLAADHGKVVLSGTGGDELFAGYPWRYPSRTAAMTRPALIEHTSDFWTRLLSPAELKQLLHPTLDVFGTVDSRAIVDSLMPERAPQSHSDLINMSLTFEARSFLPGLLAVEDKLSMAHGLESRVPFLDNDLVDFATRVPASLKLATPPLDGTGADSTEFTNGKMILRRVLARHVPTEITTRPKQGFSAPDATWFRTELADWVSSRVGNPTSPLYDYLDFSVASAALEQHTEGRANRRLLIWSLLYLDEWCRIFLAGGTGAIERE